MKIAFTSCCRYEAFPKQPSWTKIDAENPDYLFLLGDTIYMDYGFFPFSAEFIGRPFWYSNKTFEDKMLLKYQNQFEQVDNFKNLVEKMRQKNGFYGIWDDHDFAWNNAKGAHVSPQKKDISRRLFHQFMNCSTNLPHTYYRIDTPMARVIFIDNRTDAEKKGNVLLSDEQFAYIEESLKHDLEYTLICGGMTLTEGGENWRQYPAQLVKLCQLMEGKSNVFFLGGDIHRNRFVPPDTYHVNGTDYTIPPQLISSGLAINALGLGVSFDDQHNWAILELEKGRASVTFYKDDLPQEDLSKQANDFIQKYVKGFA